VQLVEHLTKDPKFEGIRKMKKGFQKFIDSKNKLWISFYFKLFILFWRLDPWNINKLYSSHAIPLSISLMCGESQSNTSYEELGQSIQMQRLEMKQWKRWKVTTSPSLKARTPKLLLLINLHRITESTVTLSILNQTDLLPFSWKLKTSQIAL